MRKKPKQLKEFLEKEKIKNKYEEKIIVKNDSAFVKLLFFFIDLIGKLLKILFYISIIVLSSIGATYIVNNFDKFIF
jgi:hypothetical protein